MMFLFLQNSNPQEDPYVPTSEDLAGFWDMVYIQVEHIHTLFAELSTIRQNGWRRPQQQVLNTHCSKSSFFVQKFNFDFPRILSIFFG